MKTYKLILYICFCLIFWNGLSAQSEQASSPIKKVVYTCICGNYDSLITHTSIHADWDYICFTDNKKLLRYKHPQWIIRPLAYAERDNTRNNRWHKMFPDKILGEYDVSLYIDGNINITNSTLIDYINNELIDDKSKTLVINKHLVRNCIYQEANACKLLKLDSESVIDNQMQMLKQLNYPETCGLTENFMIYRRHHDEEVKQLMTDWWWWVSNFSKRDQLSFNFVIWNRNFKIHIFEPQFSRSGTCLEFVNHKPK